MDQLTQEEIRKNIKIIEYLLSIKKQENVSNNKIKLRNQKKITNKRERNYEFERPYGNHVIVDILKTKDNKCYLYVISVIKFGEDNIRKNIKLHNKISISHDFYLRFINLSKNYKDKNLFKLGISNSNIIKENNIVEYYRYVLNNKTLEDNELNLDKKLINANFIYKNFKNIKEYPSFNSSVVILNKKTGAYVGPLNSTYRTDTGIPWETVDLSDIPTIKNLNLKPGTIINGIITRIIYFCEDKYEVKSSFTPLTYGNEAIKHFCRSQFISKRLPSGLRDVDSRFQAVICNTKIYYLFKVPIKEVDYENPKGPVFKVEIDIPSKKSDKGVFLENNIGFT